MANTYDLTTDTGKVRLLLNDVADPFVFTDDEIAAFLEMEAGVVKRAAALAIQTNGSNELLASKVLTSQDVSTHGESISAQMLEHARELRKQADVEAETGDDFYASVSDMVPRPVYPEFTNQPIDFCW